MSDLTLKSGAPLRRGTDAVRAGTPRRVKCRSCHCDIDMDQYLTEYIKSAAALNPTVENQLLGWLAEARDRGLEDIGSIPDLAEVSLAPRPSSILDDDSGSFVRRVLAASERLSSPVNTSDMDISMSKPGAGGRLLRPETATIMSKTRSASESGLAN